MVLLIAPFLLFLLALALVVLRIVRPEFRYTWLIGAVGSFLAWLNIIIWQTQYPLTFSLPAWKPTELFSESPTFTLDGLNYPYVLSIATLTLAVLLTTVAREDAPSSLAWAGTLVLGGLGLMAVTANNPLTLVMIWCAIDIAELVTQLRSVDHPKASERVVISFATHIAGTGLLLWANVISILKGASFTFTSMPVEASTYLIVASGLRLGVLPLHLPYSAESSLRRGFGTMLRLVSAASSLVLLAHIPRVDESFTKTLLLTMTTIAALYGGWLWLRASDELTGRPFWIIGLSSLAVSSALGANPQGSVAWGCALILTGGMLFLISIQHKYINRILLLGVLSISALPYTLTASSWTGNLPLAFQVLLILAQAMLMTGFIRNILRPGVRASLETMPSWIRSIYPAGIFILLITQIVLGIWGWEGALQFGSLTLGIIASLLTISLFWLFPRLQILNPASAQWVQPGISSRIDSVYRFIWAIYIQLGNISQSISNLLEGESGMIWVVLFIALFISLMQQGVK